VLLQLLLELLLDLLLELLLLQLGLTHLAGLQPKSIVGIGTFNACPHLAAAAVVVAQLCFIVVARGSHGSCCCNYRRSRGCCRRCCGCGYYQAAAAAPWIMRTANRKQNNQLSCTQVQNSLKMGDKRNHRRPHELS